MWMVWQKQIKELLEEIQNDQLAAEPVRSILWPTIPAESLGKTREAHLIVAVVIAMAITISDGLENEKGPTQRTPLLIHEIAFKAFFVTNAMNFIFSVSVLTLHLKVLDSHSPLSRFVRREKVLN